MFRISTLLTLLKSHRYFTFLSVLVLCFTTSSSQISKKSLKILERSIPQIYEAGEYKQVQNIVHMLYQNDKKPKAKTYTYWLNSSYQMHDLWMCRLVVKHMDSLGIEPAIKTYIPQTNQIIKRVHRILPLAPKDTSFIHDTTQIDHHLDNFNRINSIDSTFWQPNSALGLLYYRKKQYSTALKYLKIANQYQPQNDQITRLIGYSFYQIGSNESAIRYLNKVQNANTNNPEYYIVLATCHYRKNDYDVALSNARIASELDTSLLYPYWLQAECAQYLGYKSIEYDASLKQLMLGRVDESLAENTCALSKHIHGAKRSLELTSQLCDKHPNNQNLILMRLNHYSWGDKETLDAAMRDYNRLIELDSNYGRYHILKGYYLFTSPKSPEQRQRAKVALDKFYQFDSLYYNQYDYLCHLFMWYDRKLTVHYKNLAIKNMKLKWALDTNNAEVAFEMASAYDLPENGTGSGQKYNDSILKYYNISLMKGLDSLRVLTKRAHINSQLGKYDESITDHRWVADHTAQKWLRKNSFYSIAGIYKSQKQFAECRAIILQIKNEFPDDTSHKWWLRNLK